MRSFPVLIAAAGLALVALAPWPAPAAEPQEVVREMIRAMNTRDWAALEQCLAPDFRRHSGATPDLEIRTRAGFVEFQQRDAASFPDARQEVVDLFSSGNLVAVRGLYHGTQTGAMGPFPPSGKTMRLPFLAIVRVEDSRVAEIWVEWDNINALTQLGHFPPGEASAAADGPAPYHGTVEASCGQCRFGLEGEGCTLAVRMDGTAYYVEGTDIDDHGDAHAADGFCEAIRRAEVTGVVRDGKFVASAFRLLPESE